MAPQLAASGAGARGSCGGAISPLLSATTTVTFTLGQPPTTSRSLYPRDGVRRRANAPGEADKIGPLPVAEVLRGSAARSLRAGRAHATGLIHRDIKPANILLENGVERVKITDFGLRRRTTRAASQSGGWPARRITWPRTSPWRSRSTTAATCSASEACCTRCVPDAAVPRRDNAGGVEACVRGRPATGARGEPGGAAVAGRRRGEVAREEARGALPVGERSGRPARALPHRVADAGYRDPAALGAAGRASAAPVAAAEVAPAGGRWYSWLS